MALLALFSGGQPAWWAGVPSAQGSGVAGSQPACSKITEGHFTLSNT